MRIGYVRVSTTDQSTALQVDALNATRCDRIFEDKLSGAASCRPGLKAALDTMTAGDTLVVWRLDRLGRSLSDLIELVAGLQARGCDFLSLTEAIDTRSAGGKLVFHIFGAIAEFERRLIAERTRAGLEAARSRGIRLGRKPKLTAAQIREASRLIRSGESVESIAEQFGVGRSTLYRCIKGDAV